MQGGQAACHEEDAVLAAPADGTLGLLRTNGRRGGRTKRGMGEADRRIGRQAGCDHTRALSKAHLLLHHVLELCPRQRTALLNIKASENLQRSDD